LNINQGGRDSRSEVITSAPVEFLEFHLKRCFYYQDSVISPSFFSWRISLHIWGFHFKLKFQS
jgi:hypothetical protein